MEAAMDATRLGQRLEIAFPDGVRWTARSPKRLYVVVPADALLDVFEFFRSGIHGFRLGTSTVIDLYDGVGVFHHFAINGQPLVVTVKCILPKPDPKIPSLAARIPAADWIEREMHDLAGVEFVGHPDPRRLVKAAAFPDTLPLRRDFDPAAFKESIGERPEF
jgi:NADH-quinone oxidoreductase subunit C